MDNIKTESKAAAVTSKEGEEAMLNAQSQQDMNSMKKQTDEMMQRLKQMQEQQAACLQRQEKKSPAAAAAAAATTTTTTPHLVAGGVSKPGGQTNAAKSEKKRRNEIRKRIDRLRGMLPDTVRNKNVIEVLDDTILLINNLKHVLETNAQMAGASAGNLYGGPTFQNVQTLLQQSTQNAQVNQVNANHQQRLGEAHVLASLQHRQQDQETGRKNLVTMLQEQQQQQAVQQIILNHSQNQAAAGAGFIQQQTSMQGQATFTFNVPPDPSGNQQGKLNFLRDT